MPEERGAFADAARKRETQLAQRLASSVAADQEFEALLRGAVQHNREYRQRLDAIEAEVRQAAATWRGLDTPAGAHQFQQFLTGKAREIYKIVADGLADSRARSQAVQALGGRYTVEGGLRRAPTDGSDPTVHLAGWGRPLSPPPKGPANPSAFDDLLRANDQAVLDAMARVRAARKALDDAAGEAYAHGAGSDEAQQAMTRLPALKKNLADALDELGKIPDYSTIDPASVHLGPDGALSFTYTLAGQKMVVTGALENGTGEIYDQGASNGSGAYFTYHDGKLATSRFLDPGRVTPDDALLQNVIFTAVGAGPAMSAGKAGVEAGWQGMRSLFAREALEAGGGAATGLTADNVLPRAIAQAEIRAQAAADDLAIRHPPHHGYRRRRPHPTPHDSRTRPAGRHSRAPAAGHRSTPSSSTAVRTDVVVARIHAGEPPRSHESAAANLVRAAPHWQRRNCARTVSANCGTVLHRGRTGTRRQLL